MTDNMAADVLKRLERRQEAAIKEIKDRVVKALQEKRKEFCIYSFLCKPEESKKYSDEHDVLACTGLFQNKLGEGPVMRVFLELNSKAVERVLSENPSMDAKIITNYETYPVKVVLRKADDVIRKIEHLNKLLYTNHIDVPRVNATYANGFVDVYFAESKDRLRDDETITELQVNWDESIREAVKLDACLMWNVKTRIVKESMFPREIPYVDTVHYLHVLDTTMGQQYLVDIENIDDSKVYDVGQTIVVEDRNPHFGNWNVFTITEKSLDPDDDKRVMSNKRAGAIIDSMQNHTIYVKAELLRNIRAYEATMCFKKVWIADDRHICFLPKDLGYIYNEDLMDYVMTDLLAVFPGLRLEGRIVKEE